MDATTLAQHQDRCFQVFQAWHRCAQQYQESLEQHTQRLFGLLDQMFGQTGVCQVLQQRCDELERLLQECQRELAQQTAQVVELQEQLEELVRCLRQHGFDDPSPLAALGRLIAQYEQAQSQPPPQAWQRLEEELRALREQNQKLLHELGEAEQALQQQRQKEQEQQQLWLQELQALRELVQQAAQAPTQTQHPEQSPPQNGWPSDPPSDQVAQQVAQQLKKIKKRKPAKSRR